MTRVSGRSRRSAGFAASSGAASGRALAAGSMSGSTAGRPMPKPGIAALPHAVAGSSRRVRGRAPRPDRRRSRDRRRPPRTPRRCPSRSGRQGRRRGVPGQRRSPGRPARGGSRGRSVCHAGRTWPPPRSRSGSRTRSSSATATARSISPARVAPPRRTSSPVGSSPDDPSRLRTGAAHRSGRHAGTRAGCQWHRARGSPSNAPRYSPARGPRRSPAADRRPVIDAGHALQQGDEDQLGRLDRAAHSDLAGGDRADRGRGRVRHPDERPISSETASEQDSPAMTPKAASAVDPDRQGLHAPSYATDGQSERRDGSSARTTSTTPSPIATVGHQNPRSIDGTSSRTRKKPPMRIRTRPATRPPRVASDRSPRRARLGVVLGAGSAALPAAVVPAGVGPARPRGEPRSGAPGRRSPSRYRPAGPVRRSGRSAAPRRSG